MAGCLGKSDWVWAHVNARSLQQVLQEGTSLWDHGANLWSFLYELLILAQHRPWGGIRPLLEERPCGCGVRCPRLGTLQPRAPPSFGRIRICRLHTTESVSYTAHDAIQHALSTCCPWLGTLQPRAPNTSWRNGMCRLQQTKLN